MKKRQSFFNRKSSTPSSRRGTNTTEREFLAEVLEPRILYSGAPVDAALPDVQAQEVVTSSGPSAQFETIDSFFDTAATRNLDSLQEMVYLTSFDNLSEEEIEYLATIAIEDADSSDWNPSLESILLTEPQVFGADTLSGSFSLSLSTLETLADAAMTRWTTSGISGEQLAALSAIEYHIVDIEGNALGYAEGSSIFIDIDAAGRNWFIDSTPLQDEEFQGATSSENQWLAGLESAARDRIDLITVLMHEQGHILGLTDLAADQSSNLMYGSLGTGERRTMTDGQAEGSDPLSLEGRHYMTTFTMAADGNSSTTFQWDVAGNWSGGGGTDYPGFDGANPTVDDTAEVSFLVTSGATVGVDVDLNGGIYTVESLVITEGTGNADGNFTNGTLNVSNITYNTGGREIDFENSITIQGPDGGDLLITNTANHLDFRGAVIGGVGGSITVDGSRVVRFDPTLVATEVFNHSITNRDDGLTPGFTGLGSYVQFGVTNAGASPAALIGTYNVNSDGWLLIDRAGTSGTQALAVTNLSINSDVLNYRSQDTTATRIVTDNLVLNNGGNAVTINIRDWGKLYLTSGGTISGDLEAELIFDGNGHVELEAGVTSARTGATTIAGGTVRIQGADQALGTGVVTIKSGATLDIDADFTAVPGNLPTIIVEAGGALTGDLRGYTLADFGAIGSGAKVQLAEGAIWNSRTGVDITIAEIPSLEGDLVKGLQTYNETIDLNAAGNELFGAVAFNGDTDNEYRGVVTGPTGQDLNIEVLNSGSNSLTSVVRLDRDNAGQEGVVTLNSDTGVVNITLRDSGIDVYTRGAEGLGTNGNWTTLNIAGESAETAHNQRILFRQSAGTDTGYTVSDGQTLNVSNARLDFATNAAGESIHANALVNIQNGGVLYLDDDLATSGTFTIEAGGMVWINAATRLENGATFVFAQGSTLVIDNDLDPAGMTTLLSALSTVGVNIVFNDADADSLAGGLVLADNAVMTGRASGSNDFSSDITFDPTGSDGSNSVTFIAADVVQADGDTANDLRLDLNGNVDLTGVAVTIGSTLPTVTVVDGNSYINQFQVAPGGIIDFHGSSVVLGDVTVESGRLLQGDGDTDTFTASSLTHNSTETSIFSRGTATIEGDVIVTAGVVDFDRADSDPGTNVVGGDIYIGGGIDTAELQVGVAGTGGPAYSDKVLDGTFAAGSIYINQGGQFQLEITTNTSGREGPFTIGETFIISGDNSTSTLNSQLEHDIQGSGVDRSVHYADIQLEDGSVLGINEADGVASADIVLRGNATVSALGSADPFDLVDVSSNMPGESRILTIGEIGEPFDAVITGTLDSDSSLNIQVGSSLDVSAATINGGLLGAGTLTGPVVIGSTGYLAGGGLDQQGALIVVGNVSFDAGGKFLVQVDDATDIATTVQVVGDIDFTGAAIDFLAGSLGNDDSYTILTATGTISGLSTGDVFGDYAVDVTDGVVRLVRNVAQFTLTGNGEPIAFGDTSPTTSDHTILGARLTNGPNIQRTFTITNPGTQDLTISSISVGDTTHFAIANFTPGSVVAPGGTVTFDVVFLGDVVAADYLTTVTVDHDDPFVADGGVGSEDPFVFDVSATQSIFASLPQTRVEVTDGKIVITDTNPDGGKNDALTITQDGTDIIIRSSTGVQDIQALNGVTQTNGQEVRISNGVETDGITFNLRGEAFAGGDVITIGSDLLLHGDFIVNGGDIQLASDVMITASNAVFNGSIDSVTGENHRLSFGAATATVIFNGLVGATDALASLDTTGASSTIFGDNAAVSQNGLTLNWDAALDRGDGTYWDSTVNATDIGVPSTYNSTSNSNRWDWTGVGTLAAGDVSASSNLAGVSHAYEMGTSGATGANLNSFENEMSVVRNGNDSDWSNENFALEIVFRSPDLVGSHVLWESGANTGADGSVLYLEDGKIKLSVEDSGEIRTAELDLPSANEFHQITAFIDVDNDIIQLWLNGGLAAGGSQVISAETGGTFNDWSTGQNGGLGRANDQINVAGLSTFDGDFAVVRAYRLPGANFGDAEVLNNWNVLNSARVNAVSVNTVGAQSYSSSVTLGASTTLNGSTVTFTGDVTDDGNVATLSELTINATGGDLTFQGQVGSGAELSSLTTFATGVIRFTGGSAIEPLQVKSSGAQTFNGAVETTSADPASFIGDHITFGGTASFAGDTVLLADAISGIYYTSQPDFIGQISFADAVTFAGTVSVTAESFSFAATLAVGAGDSSFLATNNGTFSGRITGAGANLNVQVANVTDFSGGMEVASINTYFGGYTKIGGDVILSGFINNAFNNQVLLSGGNVVVDATGGTGGVTFGSTIDSGSGGNQSLTVNANGDIVFGGNVGSDALGSLSQDNGLGQLITGGTGTVYVRNNGTGYNPVLDPIDGDGANLYLNYVAGLDPASTNLWEDLVGRHEDLEGSSTIDYLSSNNFGDLDLNTNGAPTAVTDSSHQGIHAAFTTPAVGRSLEDFFPINGTNLSNVDVSVEVWVRPADFVGNHVIWETGQQGSSGAGLILEGSVLYWMVRESAASGEYVSVDLVNDLGLDTSDFIQIVGIYDRDLASTTAADDRITLFVNGVEVVTPVFGNIDDNSSGDDLGLGRENSSLGGFSDSETTNPFPGNADDYDNNFVGEIAIYRVWREALDANQVLAAYDAVHNGVTMETTSGVGFSSNPVVLESDLSLGALIIGIDDATTFDQLTVSDGYNLDLTNAHDLFFNIGFPFTSPPADGTAYTIIDNRNSSGGLKGEFANAPDDTEFTANGFRWKVNYNVGDGNDVVLTFLGVTTVLDAELSLSGDILTVSDVNSDSANNLTITEVHDGGVDYLVFSSAAGALGIAAASDMPVGFERIGGDTVRIDKSLVGSLIVQTAFGGDEDVDGSEDTVNINADLALTGDLTVTADNIAINGALSSGGTITLRADIGVSFGSSIPDLTGNLVVSGGIISVNTVLNVSGALNFSAATAVNLNADVNANGNVDIAVTSPDPSVAQINLNSTNLSSTLGNITLTGTKVLGTGLTLKAVDVFLFDGDDALIGSVNNTLGNTNLNGHTLTVDVTGVDGYQTGRIIGAGSLVKEGTGTWDFNAYGDITAFPNNNNAPNAEMRNDFTGGPVLVNAGTLAIAKGSQWQGRAIRNTLDVVIASGATLDLVQSNTIGDLVRVQIDAGGIFLLNSGDTIGSVTGSGALVVEGGSLQLRNDDIREFTGELTGDQNLFLLGQYNAERPWILTETGTGSYTGTIIIGNATGNNIDANPQHGLFVNGVTDAQAVSVRSQQEANNTNDNVAGTLGGIGTIQSTVTSQILTTFKPGQDGRGTLATGTLTVEGNVILGAPSQDAAINAEALVTPYYTNLEMRVDDAAGTSDRLVVTGDLDISLTDLKLFELDGSTVLSASDDPYYTLITYGGTLTGSAFNSVSGLPAGYEINFDTVGEIRLTTIEPAVVSFSPADDLSGLQVNSELVVEFNQPIVAGTGNITIVGGVSPLVIPIGDSQISISGSTLTIDPSVNLELDTEYHVLIDAGAVTDNVGNDFAGIADPTTWNFRTSDTPPPETVVRLVNGVLTITDIEGDSADNLVITDDGLGQYVITDIGGLTVGAGVGVNDTDLAPNSVSVGKSGITSIVFETKNASGDANADVVTISSAIIRSGDISITAETIYLDAPVTSTAGVVTFNGNVVLNADLSLGGSRVNFNGTVDSDAGQNRALTFEVGTGTVVFNSLVGGTDALASLDTSNAAVTLLGDNPVVAQQPFLSLNWDAALDRGDGVYWDSTINATDVSAGAPLSLDRGGNRWDWTGVGSLSATDVSATSNLAGINWAFDMGGANAGAQLGSFESKVGYPLRNGNDPNWTDENVAIEIVFSPSATDLVGGPHLIWESGGQAGEDGTAIYLEDGVLKLLSADAAEVRTVALATPLVAGQFYQVMAMVDLGNDIAKLWLNGGTAAGGEQAVSAETGGTFNDWSTSRNQGLGRVTDRAVTGNTTPGFNGLIAVMRAYRDVPDTFGDLEAKTNWDVLNTARTSSVAVTTTGSQVYSASVTLGASTTLNASEISFSGTVDDDGNGATISDLTLNATAGDITFNGNVGANADLTGLTTAATGTVHFNGGTVTVPLQVKTSGIQTYAGNVASNGNTGFIADHLYFQGTTDLGGDTSFKADGLSDVSHTAQPGFTGQVTFAGASSIAGTATLSAESFSFGSTLDLGAGTSSFLAINSGTFSDIVTGTSADLNIQVANVTDFAKGMNVASINTYFGGYTKLGGDVILNGSINNAFNNQVLITGGIVLVDATSGTGGVAFGSTIDSAEGGNQSLAVNANGDIIFGGSIGGDALGALSQDNGLGTLTTGGTGNVYLRNNGTGYGSSLFLNYVAGLDPASIDLWEDLVGAREDLEGSNTLDYLNSNNFGDLDLIANGAPSAVTSAHQGIHAAFATQGQGRGLEDFYPVDNANLSNVNVTVEVWARLNPNYESDSTARVIWETGSSGASQPGMSISIAGSVVTLAAQEDDDRLPYGDPPLGVGTGARDAGGLLEVDLGPLGLGIDLTDFVQFSISYERDGGTGASPNNDIVRLYINGVYVGAIDNVDLDDISSSDDIGLGRQTGETGGYAIDGERPTAAFNGEFAIYRVWREALDATQVQATYDAVHNGISITTTAGTFLGNTATAEVDLSLETGSQLQFALTSSGAGGTLGGTNQLVLPDGVNLDLGETGDNLLFSVDFGFATAPALDSTYTLVDNQNTAGGIIGEFENAPNNTEFEANGFRWRINYDGGDGNDVVLTYRGFSTIVDAEVTLDSAGVLTVTDATSDSSNSLTITEETDGGIVYLVITDSIGSVGRGAVGVGNEQRDSLDRTAPATVRVEKSLVTSIVIQTSFTGDEATDVSDDTVNIDAALNLTGALTITADTINVNAAISSSTNTLAGVGMVNFNSADPTVGGDLLVSGGSVNVNTELIGSGIIEIDAETSVTLSANVTTNGNVDIAVASPDPAVGAVNLGANVTSTAGNIYLSGTKQINTDVVLSAVGVFLLDGDDGVTNPGVGQTQVDQALGVTELNGNSLTIDVSATGTAGGHQTGRISGAGTLIKTGVGRWNVMPYFNLTNLPNNNTAPNQNLRNDMTGLVEVREGTLHIDGGTANQNRAFVSTLDIVIKDGAIFHLQNNSMLGDTVRVDIEAGGLFRSQGSDLMGHVTGAGTLEVLTNTLQFRPTAPFAEFNGELIGVGNLALYGRYNSESPWILNETGTGSYTGTIVVGNYSGLTADRLPNHGLYVNGVTDASDILVQVFREDDGGFEILDATFGGMGTLDLTGELEADILTTIRPGQDGKGSLVTGTLTVNGGVIFGVPSGDTAVTSLISGGVITGGPADFEGVAATTKLEMRIDAPNDTSDKLVINGDFDLKDTDLILLGIDGLTAPTADDPTYTLVTWTGSLTGDKAFKNIVTNLPAGYEVVIDEAAKEIRLETIKPAIVSFTPADDSVDVQIDSNLTIEFNQDIQTGSGNIILTDLTDNSSTITIPVTDGQITISGNTLTINPTVDLDLGTEYSVRIESGAITDTDGVANAFDGIGDDATWSFTTSASPPPETVVSLVGGVLTITDVRSDSADSLTIVDDGSGRFVITDSNGLNVGVGEGLIDQDLDNNSVTVLQTGITSIVIQTAFGGDESTDVSSDSVVVGNDISISGPISIISDSIVLNGDLVAVGDSINLAGDVSLGANVELTGTTVTLNGGLNLGYDGGSSDSLTVTGNLDVTGVTLNLVQTGAAANGTSYDLITYSGTLTGSLIAGATGVPANFRIDESTPGVIRLVETVAPTADIVDITPDPRSAAVGIVEVKFSESVTGVDITDFSLTLNGGNVDISGLTVSGSGSDYTLDLSSVTAAEGDYVLSLNATGSGIADSVGNTLVLDASDAWTSLINNEPSGTDKTITIDEDASYTFAVADFGFSDAADSPANSLQSVTISNLNLGGGTLQSNGTDVVENQVIVVADIANLVFTPAADQNGTGIASFDFAVTDDGGTAGTGVDTDQTPNRITFDVTAVNDDPDFAGDLDAADNTVIEGAANGVPVGITASFTDLEGDTITYSLSNDAGGRFEIDPNSGVVTVKNGALLDYEVATSHVITVQASDGNGGVATEDFTIAIGDVVEIKPGNTNYSGISGIFSQLQSGKFTTGGYARLFAGIGRGTFGGGSGDETTSFIAGNTGEGFSPVTVSYRDGNGNSIVRNLRADSTGNFAVPVGSGSSLTVLIENSPGFGGRRWGQLAGSHVLSKLNYRALADGEIVGQYFPLNLYSADSLLGSVVDHPLD